MPRVRVNAILSHRRNFAVAAAETMRVTAAPALRKAVADAGGPKPKEVFWMKDPKTGNWVPENRIGGDVDPVDLRRQLLSKK